MRRLPLESWKYTPLPDLADPETVHVHPGEAVCFPEVLLPAAGRIIFWNGLFVPDKRTLPQGVTLSCEPVSREPGGGHVQADKADAHKDRGSESVIADLNAAACQETIRLVVDGGRDGSGLALEVLFWAQTEGPVRAAPRLEVVCTKGARVMLLERHEGAGPIDEAVRMDIKLESGTSLEHVRLQSLGENAVNLSLLRVAVEPGGVYRGFQYTDGARLSRHQIEAVLEGPAALFDLEAVMLLRGAQIGDLTTHIRHAGPGGRSVQSVRTVLDDRARGVYQGCISVAPGADGTDARQSSKALVLSEGAEMDTKPELEILTDDVKCTHGAATGSLDPQALFYLRTRGISADRARALLIEGFICELMSGLSSPQVAADLTSRRSRWLEVCGAT